MATVDFRCEQCGKLLSVEAQEGQSVKCPHCQKKVTVPQGLASLPRPQVPGAEAPPAPPPGQPSPDAPEEELAEEPAINKTMTAMMPWVLSVFLHLGVGLIAGFITMVTVHQVAHAPAEVPYVPGEDFSNDAGTVANPGDPGSEDSARQHEMQHVVTGYSHHDSQVTGSVGNTGQMAAIISAGGGGGQAGGGWAQFGPGSGGSGHGPRAGFMGNGGNAHHVVFCIDSSGSMAFASRAGGSVFDVVRVQMLTSISRLAPVQDFHVVMFQEGPAIELPARRLQPVTPESRSAAAHWLNEVVPHGAGSDPIPALKRCFDVLANADKARKGKQIFLLTDGAFPNNDDVVRFVKANDKAKDVHVFTYLYGEQDDESAVKMMKEIAVFTGGKYKNITE
jgi:DNA-directed RNA polymerase subunit RPC12/RpoP